MIIPFQNLNRLVKIIKKSIVEWLICACNVSKYLLVKILKSCCFYELCVFREDKFNSVADAVGVDCKIK